MIRIFRAILLRPASGTYTIGNKGGAYLKPVYRAPLFADLLPWEPEPYIMPPVLGLMPKISDKKDAIGHGFIWIES